MTLDVDGRDLLGPCLRAAQRPPEARSGWQLGNEHDGPARRQRAPPEVEKVDAVLGEQVGLDGLPVLA
ncbi:hypothetical protein [Pseudoclavibacter terrae]|uniref:Uncharacterized protein n=1 Tax=Pseudoclavibacter terrae TaxID=1530195 RepID=A0A7J5B6P6_9MICO|nr:hypothetical protein [Pseudoclavibacter terrae]KAB1639868.1 hypothetical protein F8O03_06045 [Pseudoclavibacter terrae]